MPDTINGDNDPMSPRELFEQLLNRMSTGRPEEAAELYVDDFELWLPFLLPEPVTVNGKAEHQQRIGPELRDSGGKVPRLYDDLEIRDLIIHETSDPNVIVAEWTYVSRVGETTIVNPNIIVMECRDGKIVRSRDYHNHVNRARADGTIPQQLAIIENMILPEDKK